MEWKSQRGNGMHSFGAQSYASPCTSEATPKMGILCPMGCVWIRKFCVRKRNSYTLPLLHNVSPWTVQLMSVREERGRETAKQWYRIQYPPLRLAPPAPTGSLYCPLPFYPTPTATLPALLCTVGTGKGLRVLFSLTAVLHKWLPESSMCCQQVFCNSKSVFHCWQCALTGSPVLLRIRLLILSN